jgi:hypothetical protein
LHKQTLRAPALHTSGKLPNLTERPYQPIGQPRRDSYQIIGSLRSQPALARRLLLLSKRDQQRADRKAGS